MYYITYNCNAICYIITIKKIFIRTIFTGSDALNIITNLYEDDYNE